MNKKVYSKPQLNSEKLNAGVFGNYGGGCSGWFKIPNTNVWTVTFGCCDKSILDWK